MLEGWDAGRLGRNTTNLEVGMGKGIDRRWEVERVRRKELNAQS